MFGDNINSAGMSFIERLSSFRGSHVLRKVIFGTTNNVPSGSQAHEPELTALNAEWLISIPAKDLVKNQSMRDTIVRSPKQGRQIKQAVMGLLPKMCSR